MKGTAVFTIEVAPPRGVYADFDFELKSFETTYEGHQVRLFPAFEDEIYGDPEGGAERERYLRSFRVEIDHETDVPGGTKEERERLWAIAQGALRPFLYGLKRETHDSDVDVRMNSLKWTVYINEDGTETPQWWASFRLPDYWINPVDDVMWNRVSLEIGSAGPSLEARWLMDALAFHSREEFDLALTAAAIALESSARRLLMWKFNKGFGISAEDAEDRVRDMNAPEVGQWLVITQILPRTLLADLKSISELRNKIVHGHHREVTPGQALLAIRTAITVQNQLAAATGETPYPKLIEIESQPQ